MVHIKQQIWFIFVEHCTQIIIKAGIVLGIEIIPATDITLLWLNCGFNAVLQKWCQLLIRSHPKEHLALTYAYLVFNFSKGALARNLFDF